MATISNEVSRTLGEYRLIPRLSGVEHKPENISLKTPFAYYAEMLQTDLNFFKFVYENSIIGKWADATGNHHSATALGVDGIKLQEEFCKHLGVGFMDAPAQIPGLEFEADIFYAMARTGETINNLAKYIALGRGDDVNIFVNANPKRKKGSSAMPHKDAKNGNPTAEEQVMSVRNYLVGNMTTGLLNCEMPYARNLAASSNSRINFSAGFKFLDHGIRRLSNVVYWLGLNEERSLERVERSFGCPTSQQVMTYLTDHNKTSDPMTREDAHNLMARLSTYAWENKQQLGDVILRDRLNSPKLREDASKVRERLSQEIITEITDPLTYIGESKRIIDIIADKHYQRKTLT